MPAFLAADILARSMVCSLGDRVLKQWCGRRVGRWSPAFVANGAGQDDAEPAAAAEGDAQQDA